VVTRARHFRAVWPVATVLLVLGRAEFASATDQPAGPLGPTPIVVERLRWVRPPGLTGVQVAWVVGAEREPGLYALRVQLAPGARIPPHTHPDERVTTVLRGTLYVGFGDGFAERSMVAVPTGAVYLAPALVPHYLWAKDGEVLYQESGAGPTGTAILER